MTTPKKPSSQEDRAGRLTIKLSDIAVPGEHPSATFQRALDTLTHGGTIVMDLPNPAPIKKKPDTTGKRLVIDDAPRPIWVDGPIVAVIVHHEPRPRPWWRRLLHLPEQSTVRIEAQKANGSTLRIGTMSRGSTKVILARTPPENTP